MNKAFHFLLVLIIMAVVLPAPSFHVSAQGDCDPVTDYISVGYDALDAWEYEEAYAAFDCAVQLITDPVELADAYYGRGEANWYLEDYDAAFQDYEAGIELDPANPYLWLSRGVYYHLITEDYEKALSDYDQTIELDPEYSDAYYWRGCLYQDSGSDDLAIQDFDSALSLNPSDAYAYLYRGMSYQFLGDDETAIADFDQSIDLDSENSYSYTYRGMSYQYLGDDNKAIEDFNRALELDPDNWLARYHRGLSYQYTGKDQEAVADFDQAIFLNPAYKEAYSGRALSNIYLGNTAAAMEDLELGAELDEEDDPLYTLYLAVLYRVDGDDDAALDIYQQLLEEDSDDPYLNQLVGKTLFFLGRDEEALEYFDVAYELAEEDDVELIADTQFYRGVTYYEMGDYDAALEDLNASAEYNEDDSWTYFRRNGGR